MAVDNPWAIDGLPLTALAWRRAMSGLLLRSGDTVSAVAGVLTGCGVTVAGSNATVAAGQVVVTPAAGNNGSYIVGLTSTVLALTARDATYGRIDRVAIRVWDNSVDGLGQDKADAIIVTGTPAASPVAPALPAGVLELAQLQVPNAAGGAVTVVDRRRRTTANGGIPWFPDTATRDVVLPAPQPGQMCVTGTATNQVVWVWGGAAWSTIWANQLPFGARSGVSPAVQSIPNSTTTKVEILSVDGGTQGGVTWANHEFTVPRTGIYMVAGRLVWATTPTTGQRTLFLMRSGSNQGSLITPGSAGGLGQTLTALIPANAGQTIYLACSQTSGGAMNILNNAGQCSLAVAFLG